MTDRPSATEAARAFLDAVGRHEATVRAFTHIDPERLHAEAARCDAAAETGPLAGIPVAVKEVFDVRGYRCSWGTPLMAERRPETDCTAVIRLRSAGAFVAGITVSTEFALAAAGPTANPHDAARTPGGSSQGSAAAVGAGMVPLALGTQTIGSVIRPAAYCGVVGFKPTHGAIPIDGVMPLSAPLDHVGLLAAEPAIAAAALSALTLSPTPRARPDGVAVIQPWWSEPTDPLVIEAVAGAAHTLRGRGFALSTVEIPPAIAGSEAATLKTLLAHDFARWHGEVHDISPGALSPQLRALVENGREISAMAYDAACTDRRAAADTLSDLLGNRVGLCAATVDRPPPRADGTGSRAPQRLWSLTGLPVVTVPVLWRDGLPVAVQLVAPHGHEPLLWDLAEILFAPSPR